jgi:Tol biopolymer transport system component
LHGFTLSPDGSRALATLPDGQDVWLLNLETNTKLNLTAGASDYAFLPTWWPARPGTVVAGSGAQDRPDDWVATAGHLTIINVDGSGYRVLDKEATSFSPPAPSPDGQTIAYTRLSEPWLYHLGTGRVPFDMAAYGLTLSSDHKAASPAWSHDGGQLAWWIQKSTGMDVVVFDLEQNTHHIVYKSAATDQGSWPYAPVWSPDGAWLAVIAENESEAGLWVVGAGDKQVEKKRYLGGYNPVWSPGGTWLAYIDDQYAPEAKVWLANPNTGETYFLDLPPGAAPIAWIETE